MSTDKDLKDFIDSCQKCCMHAPIWTSSDILWALLWRWKDNGNSWADGPKIGTDSESFAICILKDGSFGVFEESEDYTGHGCQCSSSTSQWATIKEVIALGLTPEQREGLEEFTEKEVIQQFIQKVGKK